jgi:VWFA-related protein
MLRRLPLLLLAALPLFAQKFEEKVTVDYIEVPVTVLGRDNVPVRGLTKANFEIRDDNEKREIESFDAIDFAAEGGTSAKVISPLNPASRRNFLLLFDLTYSTPQTIVRAQEAARNFVARSIGRRDAVAVGVVDIDHGFRFLTAFTTDRELLTAAIAEPRSFRSRDPLQIASKATLEVGPEGMAQTRQGTDMALENMRDLARLTNRLDDSFKRSRLKRQVAMLADIARTLQRLSGRKHLVLLSEGFDPRLVQGRGNQTEEDRAIESGETWKVDSDQRFGSAESQKQIQLMAEQFRRADVVLHAVDIQGVRVANDVSSGAKFNSNEGLFLLANSTGGTVFRNSNDITSEFDRLARQHDVVYVLGFRAPAGRAARARRPDARASFTI